jgi:hypothetical protein
VSSRESVRSDAGQKEITYYQLLRSRRRGRSSVAGIGDPGPPMWTVAEADINDAGYPSARHLSLEMAGPMGEALVSGEAAVLA